MTRLGRSLIVVLAALWALPAGADLPWDHTAAEFPGQTSIPRDVVDLFDEHCGLSQAQRGVAEALYQRHLQAFAHYAETVVRPALRRHNAAIKAIEDIAAQLPARIEAEVELGAMADHQNELDEQFLLELQTILTERQRESWEGFVHAVNRERYLSASGRYSDQEVDLLALLEQIELQPAEIHDAEALAGLREEYARRLDAALLQRVRISRALARTHYRDSRKQKEANRPVEYFDDDGRLVVVKSDPEAIEAYRRKHQEHHDAHGVQRDLNRTFKELFIQQLTPTAADRLRDAWDRVVLSRWWIRENGKTWSFVTRLVESDLLSDDQADAARTIADRVEARRKEIARKQVRTSDELVAASWGGRKHGTWEEAMTLREELQALVKKKLQIDNQGLEQVWALLTLEQRAQVEKPEPWDENVSLFGGT